MRASLRIAHYTWAGRARLIVVLAPSSLVASLLVSRSTRRTRYSVAPIGCFVGNPVIVLAGGRESSFRHRRQLLLERHWVVLSVPDPQQLLSLANARRIDVAIAGASESGHGDVLKLVALWHRAQPRLRVVLMATQSSEDLVLAALRAGVFDYLREPVSDAELLASVERALVDAAAGLEHGRPPPAPWTSTDPMVGASRVMCDVRSFAERVGRTDSNVLITGETGVGKELVAEMIHACSARRHKPCVAINCAAIPETLLESELFGFERGAFTGADRGREGTLKSADGGSVLFDEIGDMGLAAQAKILRAIEAREIHRLGGGSRVPLDVRVISATNQDLERLVAEGRFRKDLYYRLNVARIHLPPLRQRLDDLELLLDFYIGQFNRRFRRQVEGLTPEALDQLRRHDWPGNIRELKNLVEAIFVNLDGRWITQVDLPEAFRRRLAQRPDVSASERERLVNALFATNWNKSKAAEELNWSRMTLYRKLAKYHVVRDAAARKPT
jgi:DNA-binding NtrC family response regulator